MMKMKYVVMGGLLLGSMAVQANGLSANNPEQPVAEEKRTEAQLLAAEKRVKAEQARARHQARHEEERAAGKILPPEKKRYSLN